MKKLLQSKRYGSAISLVVVAVMILLVMGVGLLNLGMKGRIYSIRTASDIAARCAADAGLTMALYEMNEKLKVKPWNDSSFLKQQIKVFFIVMQLLVIRLQVIPAMAIRLSRSVHPATPKEKLSAF